MRRLVAAALVSALAGAAACVALLGADDVGYASADAAALDADAAGGDAIATGDAAPDAPVAVCDGGVVDFSCTAAQATGLVAYWSFDEGDGGTLHDCVGSNDGTLENLGGGALPTFVPSPHGRALVFDGVDQLVDLGAPSSLNFIYELTVSAWVKPASSTKTGTVIANNADWVLLLETGSVKFGFLSPGIGSQSVSAGVLPQDTWAHVAIVFRLGQPEIWLNGVLKLQSSDAGQRLENGNHASIGATWRATGTDTFFVGAIDEVRAFKRALSACEIQALAAH
jgi:hypothetical protein